MKNLPFLDLAVIALYLIGMVLVGVFFRERTTVPMIIPKHREKFPAGLSDYQFMQPF